MSADEGATSRLDEKFGGFKHDALTKEGEKKGLHPQFCLEFGQISCFTSPLPQNLCLYIGVGGYINVMYILFNKLTI